MSNLFSAAASRFSELRHAAGASEITYARGLDSVTISATVGRVEADPQELSDFVVDSEGVDFIIRRADLDFGAGAVDPERGDVITLNNGFATVTYDVLPDATDAVFKRCDEFGYDLRVHTERRSEA